jgi:hypothetical protein
MQSLGKVYKKRRLLNKIQRKIVWNISKSFVKNEYLTKKEISFLEHLYEKNILEEESLQEEALKYC